MNITDEFDVIASDRFSEFLACVGLSCKYYNNAGLIEQNYQVNNTQANKFSQLSMLTANASFALILNNDCLPMVENFYNVDANFTNCINSTYGTNITDYFNYNENSKSSYFDLGEYCENFVLGGYKLIQFYFDIGCPA